MSMVSGQWISRLVLDTDVGNFLGDTRIRLLEAIMQHGSISQAAKAVPLSYKSAWDAVDIMNNLAEEPVVVASTGGRNGGGTVVTPYGQKLITLYRAIEREYQQSIERLASVIPQLADPDVPQLRGLLKSMNTQFSARNQFRGKVVALRADEVDFEVGLRLDSGDELTAVITGESAERLGIQLGAEVQALIKSSAVVLSTDRELRTSARNQLWGEITRIHEGAVHAEVVLALASGKTITAVVTRDSVAHLQLATGMRAAALFQASSVILATYR